MERVVAIFAVSVGLKIRQIAECIVSIAPHEPNKLDSGLVERLLCGIQESRDLTVRDFDTGNVVLIGTFDHDGLKTVQVLQANAGEQMFGFK